MTLICVRARLVTSSETYSGNHGLRYALPIGVSGRETNFREGSSSSDDVDRWENRRTTRDCIIQARE